MFLKDFYKKFLNKKHFIINRHIGSEPCLTEDL